jgi:DNA-directed RNA polymerase-4 subunit 1
MPPFQVHYLLKCVDLEFIKKFVLRTDSLFLNCFPVTPNCHRVSEVPHAVSDGQQLVFVRILSFTAFLVLK